MQRSILVALLLILLAGCMSSGPESFEPKACPQREIDAGLCVPGEYDPQ